ncbi:DUF6415 family natural product biosynthesis protein [Streptomyces chrestomyceticus]|uniref:DUF6415 family natural product biosynthesis protein n=1 Tax=Streptomyces chrestomyceticus TaxID=68185 RepID=A0ABU7X6U5_9ACTN
MPLTTAAPGVPQPSPTPPAPGRAEPPAAAVQATVTHVLARRRYVPGLRAARQQHRALVRHIELLVPVVEERTRSAWAGSETERLVVSGLACLRYRLDRGLPPSAEAAWASVRATARQCQALLDLTSTPLDGEARR